MSLIHLRLNVVKMPPTKLSLEA